jgi:hypothetical protein
MKIEIETGRDTEVLVRKNSVVIECTDRETFVISIISAIASLGLSTEEKRAAVLAIAGSEDDLIECR